MTTNNVSGNEIPVRFTNVSTGRHVKFAACKDAKFDGVIDEAYKELGDHRKPTDKFYCMNGTPLNSYLDKSLHDVVDNDCKEADFEIRGKSGGAFFYCDVI